MASTFKHARIMQETIARYERFLRAVTTTRGGCEAHTLDEAHLLDGMSMIDAQEWLAETAVALLDGQEAECPLCSTPVHEGACVDEDAEIAPPAKCRACGCTDLDCRGCIARTGTACHWVEPDLCSACADLSKLGVVRDA